MKIVVAILMFAVASIAFGQAPPAPKAPAAVGSTGGTVCDMYGVVDGSVAVNGADYDAGYAYVFAPAIPSADVADNHAKWVKVLDVASKEQDKGGPYELEVSEYRSCDGGGVVKITDGSLLLKGLTLSGITRIVDEALKQGQALNNRTKARAKDAKSVDHDHTKAKKVKRDDLGKKVRD